MTSYRSVFVSDIHLGTRMSQADAFMSWFRNIECQQLYLVGDIVDGWALSHRFYWPQSHNDVIQKIMRQARKGTRVTYLPGNHDEFLRGLGEQQFGRIRLVDSCDHVGHDGLRYRVLHGDQFDVVIKNAKWLAHLGTWAYDAVMRINLLISWVRRLLGLKPWSLSAWAKYKVKQAVNFIGEYEENLAGFAARHGYDGIICGHIHHANIREVHGMLYMNCGDWVESCTALVEHLDGRWEIVRWNHSVSA